MMTDEIAGAEEILRDTNVDHELGSRYDCDLAGLFHHICQQALGGDAVE